MHKNMTFLRSEALPLHWRNVYITTINASTVFTLKTVEVNRIESNLIKLYITCCCSLVIFCCSWSSDNGESRHNIQYNLTVTGMNLKSNYYFAGYLMKVN